MVPSEKSSCYMEITQEKKRREGEEKSKDERKQLCMLLRKLSFILRLERQSQVRSRARRIFLDGWARWMVNVKVGEEGRGEAAQPIGVKDAWQAGRTA